jgi:hypothetical protein
MQSLAPSIALSLYRRLVLESVIGPHPTLQVLTANASQLDNGARNIWGLFKFQELRDTILPCEILLLYTHLYSASTIDRQPLWQRQ